MTDEKAKPKDLQKWSTEDLEKLSEELAKERTKVRLAQNAVSAELEIRRSMEQMSPETRKVLSVRLGGTVTPTGEGAPS